MVHLDTRALTRGSSDIVIGEVERTTPRWSADHRRIFTDVDLRITRTLKGSPAQHLTLTQLGGERDGVRYSVPGGPLFRPGADALLFVWRDSRGVPQVNGLAQGKFDIARDPRTGMQTVQRNVPGFEVSDAKTLAVPGATRATSVSAAHVPLDDLVREIEGALHEEGGR
jgi:hypothetical protein